MSVTPTASPSYNFSEMSLLIIDDNEFARRLLKDICARFRFGEVWTAGTAQDALRTLAAKRIDFVLCDWMLGAGSDMDGIELTHRIRHEEDNFNPFVAIIMLTSFADVENVARARDAGVTEFLAKPVSPARLLLRFTHIIDHPRPFVRVGDYIGPDRRRHRKPYDGPERRNRDDADERSGNARDLSATEIDAILSHKSSAAAR